MNEFLDDLFGEQTGVVYSPVMGERWQQYFFEWPQERDKLERHINDYDERDVYLSPVLFSEKRIAPETFKGTRYLWTEFDGTLPQGEIIDPSIRVSSSVEGHEHWYWRLNEFTTSKAVIEDLNKRIVYHYGGDLSVHDYQNVLRPIDTWNHKRNKPVTLLSKSERTYTIEEFLWIPTVEPGTSVNVRLGSLPDRNQILAKYKWKPDTLDLLFKELGDEDDRSAALMRLAFDAVEAGCSNEETYVLIEERDSLWGKYTGRTDREKQLQTIISRVRSKKAHTVVDIAIGTPQVYSFQDFMRTNIHLKWAIEGLLPVAGSMVIFGTPGIGKSTFSIRMAMDLALGKDRFLIWNIVHPQRTLFLSLEMQHYEVKEFYKDMQISEEDAIVLQEKFFTWPIGTAYPLDTPDQQIELLKYIDMHKIEAVVIDSISLSMYGSITNDDDVKRLNSFLNEDVRRDRGCSYIFIHHPRKKGLADPNLEAGLDESFGSGYITANAQTVMVLSQKSGSPRLRVKLLKTRLSVGADSFELERTPDRGFTLVGERSESTVVHGEIVTDKRRDVNPLRKQLGF